MNDNSGDMNDTSTEQSQHFALTIDCSRVIRRQALIFELAVAQQPSSNGDHADGYYLDQQQRPGEPDSSVPIKVLFKESVALVDSSFRYAGNRHLTTSANQVNSMKSDSAGEPSKTTTIIDLDNLFIDRTTNPRSDFTGDAKAAAGDFNENIEASDEPANRSSLRDTATSSPGGRLMSQSLDEQLTQLGKLVFTIQTSDLVRTSEPRSITGSELVRTIRGLASSASNGSSLSVEKAQSTWRHLAALMRANENGDGNRSRNRPHPNRTAQVLRSTNAASAAAAVSITSDTAATAQQQQPQQQLGSTTRTTSQSRTATTSGQTLADWSRKHELSITVAAIFATLLLSALTLTLIVLLIRRSGGGRSSAAARFEPEVVGGGGCSHPKPGQPPIEREWRQQQRRSPPVSRTIAMPSASDNNHNTGSNGNDGPQTMAAPPGAGCVDFLAPAMHHCGGGGGSSSSSSGVAVNGNDDGSMSLARGDGSRAASGWPNQHLHHHASLVSMTMAVPPQQQPVQRHLHQAESDIGETALTTALYLIADADQAAAHLTRQHQVNETASAGSVMHHHQHQTAELHCNSPSTFNTSTTSCGFAGDEHSLATISDYQGTGLGAAGNLVPLCGDLGSVVPHKPCQSSSSRRRMVQARAAAVGEGLTCADNNDDDEAQQVRQQRSVCCSCDEDEGGDEDEPGLYPDDHLHHRQHGQHHPRVAGTGREQQGEAAQVDVVGDHNRKHHHHLHHHHHHHQAHGCLRGLHAQHDDMAIDNSSKGLTSGAYLFSFL